MKPPTLLLLLVLTGCSTLNTSHIQNVNSFAVSANKLSAAPGELYQEIADFRNDLRLVESATLFSSDKIIPRLNQVLQRKEEFESNVTKTNAACSIIGNYAQSLLLLVDVNYHKQLGVHSGEMGLRISSAISSYNSKCNQHIPVSIGGFLSNVVNKIGSIRLRQLQKKYLQEFVDTGSVVINDVCGFLTDNVAPSIENELSSLDSQFENIFLNFYDNIEQYQRGQQVDPYDYLAKYNPMYINMKEKLMVLHNLHIKTLNAVKLMQQTHEQLRITADAEPPAGLVEKIKTLFNSFQDISAEFDRIQKDKSKF